jgi:formylglycine-generating enzyme required for sulfatase activity
MAKIYISSTYQDLIAFREAVYRALRRMRHDVIAMEDYVATDQRPLDKCLADVADCDVYVGIFAWRYGYIPPGQKKSITELEFRQAVKEKKTCLIFLLDEEGAWSPKLMDAVTRDGDGGERINTLRQELKRDYQVDSFKTPDDLAGKVSTAVSRWAQEQDQATRPATPKIKVPRDHAKLRERYLSHLVDRYRYLDFRGMGVSDRVPLRLPLIDMYVPLKARIELPEGETWARQLRLAGRQVTDEEAESIGHRLSEPTPVLDLLHEQDGLIILGDPGAGKTTFLKYLALRLALGEGEALGVGGRLPVLLSLSAYANALTSQDIPLDRFIARYYDDLGIDTPVGPLLDEALAQGGALLLLDGLDEVRGLAQRHLVVKRVVDFFTFRREGGNKFILTSRVVGYREVRPIAEGLAECTLVDFEDEDITTFIEKWTGALERAARGDTAVAAREATREQDELLAAVGRNPGVRQLAANPLLLTILALMKRQGVTLPERRVELYQRYVETLLKHWNLARGLDRPPSRDLDVVETMRVLAPLALWMHETSPGVGLVKREAMQRVLEAIYADREVPEPEQAARQFLADVREYAGLLLERGAGQYGFIHLTFQEYLAAVAVALRGQRAVEPVVEALAAHVGDDNWREVTLLTIGYMGIVQQRDEAAGMTLWELIQAAPGEPGQATVLAGEAVVDAWPGGVTRQCRQQVAQALLETVIADQSVKPTLRAASGDALARLGDPRFRAEAWHLPNEPLLGFVEVPAGPFLMGSDKKRDQDAYEDELPQHRLELPLYYIARYPVTVAQFRAFVQESSYQAQGPWERYSGGDNRPVVAVNWYDALAYCRWLTEQLRGWEETPEPVAGLLSEEGWGVRLPTEAEWEKAARGQDGRIFPWGNNPDSNRANYGETGVDTTSAVGCFPSGASPYGALDMAGNVWEWTQSLWGKSYERPDFKYPYRAEDGRENLEADDSVRRVCRGGAFSYYQGYVRSACRSRSNPDFRLIHLGFRVVVAPGFL